jgi:error-prone DNA polymerase
VERAAPLAAPVAEAAPQLPLATAGERVVLDYAGTGLTLGPHPLALLRPQLRALRCADTRALEAARQGAWIRLAGLVLVRQRPGSAKGVMFFTLEDEHGVANLVLYADLQRRHRREIVAARLLVAEGRVERTEAHVPILHLIARRLEDRSELLHGLHALERQAVQPGHSEQSRAMADSSHVRSAPAGDAFGRAIAHADEVLRPNLSPDPRVKRKEALRQLSRDFH